MAISKEIEVYINLLDEGIPVLRPTMAEMINDSLCRILPTPNYDPEDEIWEFLPGTIVKYEASKTDKGENILVAKELAYE